MLKRLPDVDPSFRRPHIYPPPMTEQKERPGPTPTIMSTTIEVKGDDVIEEEEIQDVSSVEMEDHPSDMIIVLAERKRVGVPQRSSAPTIEERLAILQQVKSRIKTMIAEDIPLFTMEGIRDVHEQVQKCMAQGGKGDILVKGLDGIMVRFQLHIGQTYDWADYIRCVVS